MKVLTNQQHYQDIAEAIRAKTGKEGTLKPAQMAQELNDLNIDLEEAYVTPTTEQQEILPPEGVYGFSKITVEAVEDSGGDSGGGDIIINGGAAEDMTFGNETVEDEVPTGKFDYGDSDDGSSNVYPGIPEGKYQLLLRSGLKQSQTFYITVNGTPYRVESNVPACMYYVHWTNTRTGYQTYSVLGSTGGTYGNFFKYNLATGGTPASQGVIKKGNYGYFAALWSNTTRISVSGLPFYELGSVRYDSDIEAAMYGLGNACMSGETSPEDDTRIVIVSDTPITSDGTHINNADGSPMTVYQYNSETDTWDVMETTTGSDYSIGSSEIIWNSHDISNSETGEVTFEASDPAQAETTTSTVTRPVDRNEDYIVNGNTMNDIVSIAQKITGTNEPMTPEQAAAALEEYYASLNAG